MKTITASQIAEMVKGTILGDANKSCTGVSGVKYADSNTVSFVGSKKYQHQLESTAAGIVLINKDLEKEPLNGRTFIVCDNVDLAFAAVLQFFAPEPVEYAPGIHPAASVDPSAVIGKNVHIGACAVIERGAVIGDNTVILPGAYIGVDAKVGCNCYIAPNAVVMYRCVLGNKCIIHSGVVIGADGFGFIPGPQGLVKVPQTGIVEIGNDVEIGANTTIDRARFGVTRIKDNVKIDNQVMIAHNVEIGESSILVAQCGIAGSAEIGRGVILAAKVGINGHITIGDGAQVAGTSGVVKSLPAGAIAMGTPAEGQREFMTRMMLPKKVEKLQAKIEALTAEIEKLKAAVQQ